MMNDKRKYFFFYMIKYIFGPLKINEVNFFFVNLINILVNFRFTHFSVFVAI